MYMACLALFDGFFRMALVQDDIDSGRMYSHGNGMIRSADSHARIRLGSLAGRTSEEAKPSERSAIQYRCCLIIDAQARKRYMVETGRYRVAGVKTGGLQVPSHLGQDTDPDQSEMGIGDALQ
jgi:hypothetical protein